MLQRHKSKGLLGKVSDELGCRLRNVFAFEWPENGSFESFHAISQLINVIDVLDGGLKEAVLENSSLIGVA